MKHIPFYLKDRFYSHFPSLRRRWGRILLLTFIIWLMAWSLSFAQDGARPEISVNMPSQVENNGEPFDIQVSVRNVGNEAVDYGSITLSFPEGHDVSIVNASVATPQSAECVLEGSHARVLGPDSGCEALRHNTACQERDPIQQPIAELFHRGWGAGEQQSMTVRVFPNPNSSFVTVYIRAAFRAPGDDNCELIIEPEEFAAQALDQQNFPVYSGVIELVDTPTEVVPTDTPLPPTEEPTETPLPPTETPVPPTETPVPPTEVPVEPTDVPALVEPSATVAEPTTPPQPEASPTTEPAPPTAVPSAESPANQDQDFITLLLSEVGSNFTYIVLCVMFIVLFLILCLLIWLLLRSRGSSNPPPTPSQPFNPQPPINSPSYPIGSPSYPQPPINSPSYPVGSPSYPQPPINSPSYPQPPINSPSYPVPPSPGYGPSEHSTRQWGNNTPGSQTPPYSQPPHSTRKWGNNTPGSPRPPFSQPMDPTQAEVTPPPSPFATQVVVSTPPIDPTCFQCGINQSEDAGLCANCGFSRPVVGGRYALLRHLGKGGMGAVYLAQDKRITGKQWAIKEMLDQSSSSPEMQQKIKEAFEQEAQLLALLQHPNLPRVIDFLSEEERYYLVMDFVEGETLKSLLNMRQTPFSERDVLGWAAQLCDVLSYLHNQQPPIIFRDLKPSNIMLTPNGQIKLIDFGIARLFKPDRDQDTLFMGTPGYAAPEQFSGSSQTDARTDVYALGVVLHNLLTKHPPETTMFTMPKVRELNPAVSPRMEAVIEQALRHDPGQRFASVQAFKTALGL